MAKSFPPTTMRAWQYSSTKGGIERNLKLNTVPVPKPRPNQHLIQVLDVALNPVDYQIAEHPIIGSIVRPKVATPGIDFAGRIVTPAAGSSFTPGQRVFGVPGTSPIAAGALKEFIVIDAEPKTVAALPDGVSSIDGASLTVAGLTAYQSIATRVKHGNRVFINGGSGGVGAFGIQLAKIAGCHVTTTCSTPNVELCRSLGADVVIDYKTQDVVEALKTAGYQFDHAVDNAGKNRDLIWSCGEWLKPDGTYVLVSGSLGFEGLKDGFKRRFLPKALGGLQRKVEGFWPKPNVEHMTEMIEWMKEGKMRAVVDSEISFEDAPAAFKRSKTGRARGKVVITVASENEKPLS